MKTIDTIRIGRVRVDVVLTKRGKYVPIEVEGDRFVVRRNGVEEMATAEIDPGGLASVVLFSTVLGRSFLTHEEAEGFALREWPALRAARPGKAVMP